MSNSEKRICFRTKGDHKQGMGDLMGSLSLAAEFASKGHKTYFIVDADERAIGLIRSRRHEFSSLGKGGEKAAWGDNFFDIAVINRLTSPMSLLNTARSHCSTLVTIDDTGTASKRLADIRINPLYYADGAYCDPSYIPLDPVFQRAHESQRNIKDTVKNLLITMGGSDTYDFTPQILRALVDHGGELNITVIIGPAFKHRDQLERTASKFRTALNMMHSVDQKTMCERMLWADLAICGGGNTLFEMACCGTPVIVVCAEPFEEETAFRLEGLGFGKVIHFNKRLDRKAMFNHIQSMDSTSARRRQSEAGLRLIDGRGIERICDKVMESVHIYEKTP